MTTGFWHVLSNCPLDTLKGYLRDNWTIGQNPKNPNDYARVDCPRLLAKTCQNPPTVPQTSENFSGLQVGWVARDMVRTVLHRFRRGDKTQRHGRAPALRSDLVPRLEDAFIGQTH